MNVTMTVRANRKVVGCKTVDIDRISERLCALDRAMDALTMRISVCSGQPYHYRDFANGKRVTVTVQEAAA